MNNNTSIFYFMNKLYGLFCSGCRPDSRRGLSCAPYIAQDRAVQAMTLTTLYNLADQQSQKVKVSEVALRAANEGLAAAKSALLPSVDLSLQGSYYGQCLHVVARFFG